MEEYLIQTVIVSKLKFIWKQKGYGSARIFARTIDRFVELGMDPIKKHFTHNTPPKKIENINWN